MPKSNFISTKDVQLLVWDLTESIDELRGQLTSFNEVEFSKIVSEKRKREFLGIRVAMKELLGREVQIGHDIDGKPFLLDNSYQISISHSKNWIAVMAHPTCSIGVDIECPNNKIQKIYARFLSEAEQRDLSNGKNLNQLQLAWSVKESLYKIIGKEAVDFANQLRVFPFEAKALGEIIAQHTPTKKLYQLRFIQNPAYTLVYCVD
jgi:4'-phosphopantetheinyl transferase